MTPLAETFARIAIVVPALPTPESDLVAPYSDMVIGSAATIMGFADGQLQIRYELKDPDMVAVANTIILHDIGHLLTLSPERWYQLNGSQRGLVDFHFRDPKTFDGAMRLIDTEFAAMAVEQILHQRYTGRPRFDDPTEMMTHVCNNVTMRFAQNQKWSFDMVYLRNLWNSKLVLNEYEILDRWDRLIAELRRMRVVLKSQTDLRNVLE